MSTNPAFDSNDTFATDHTSCSSPAKTRRASEGQHPSVLTDIYQRDINIAIWKRALSPTLVDGINSFLRSNPSFQSSMTVSPESALESTQESLGISGPPDAKHLVELSENIAELVDMFCYLFDLKRAGLRLTSLNQAMCPRFHVDKVPCRLVTTFQGVATEWLPHEVVNREKLGRGSEGKPDHLSGLFQSKGQIQQLNSGDVALLKGERWEGNENAGLVHRSPVPPSDSHRLLLTLDFSY